MVNHSGDGWDGNGGGGGGGSDGSGRDVRIDEACSRKTHLAATKARAAVLSLARACELLVD